MGILREAGLEIDNFSQQFPSFDHMRFLEHMKDADALIIGAHKISSEDMDQCQKLKIICKHGAGLDNIDLQAAASHGITVTNVPAVNAGAVADLAFGLLLCCARKIDEASQSVRAGKWRSFIGVNVHGKTLGLIGFGAIAKEMTKRAAGFQMKVLTYDPYVKAIPAAFPQVERVEQLRELLHRADMISIHVPLNDQTRNLISAKEMEEMKDGAILVNTSRGGIVDEPALMAALESGKPAAAALDVLSREQAVDNPIVHAKNILVTPHIGMYSAETINAVSVTCARNVVKRLTGEQPAHVVETGWRRT